MSRGNYDTRAPSASNQIITLERLLEEAEERNAELQAENKALRDAAKLFAEVLHLDESDLRLIYVAPEKRAALAALIGEE